ncbi:MAG: ChbG/HpnK family deacetylase [Planctomyces sp.]|nr:ChbG/HpnK family deacetylase [Planctomyces sp.]
MTIVIHHTRSQPARTLAAPAAPASGERRERCAVVNADDFGFSTGVNIAVERAAREGVLTSASLMTNGAAFDHALDCLARAPRLGIGLHLCLTSGRSLLPHRDVPALTDSNGRFRLGFLQIAARCGSGNATFLEQVERELAAQFERLHAVPRRIDHVNSHRYVHTIPAIHAIVERLARPLGHIWIRRPVESLGPIRVWRHPAAAVRRLCNLPKRLVLKRFAQQVPVADRPGAHAAYRGLLDSGRMTAPTLRTLLDATAPGVTEVVTHPAVAGQDIPDDWSAADRRFAASRFRETEFQALVDRQVLALRDTGFIRLATFAEAPRIAGSGASSLS